MFYSSKVLAGNCSPKLRVRVVVDLNTSEAVTHELIPVIAI